MKRVQYFSYILDENEVHVDCAMIQSICDWMAPTTLTKLHSFLILANLYHRFMLGFSHIFWLLIQVTKGGGKHKFVWANTQ